MNPNIQAALDAAKANAQAAVAQTASVPSTIPQSANAVAAPAARRLSMDEVLPNLTVDKYLKADLRGIKIDDDVFEELTVSIDLGAVQACKSVKWQVGTQAFYAKSYDGVREAQSGQDWAATIEKAKQLDTRTRGDYPSCEIPMLLLDAKLDPKSKKKVEDILEANVTTLGYQTSTTGHALFMKAFQAARAQGLRTAVMRVTSAAKKNVKIGSEYAVLEWELISQ